MNTPMMGLRVASVLFGLMCLGQLIRLLLRLEFSVAGYPIPDWGSGIAVIVTGVLCGWLWRLAAPARAGTYSDVTTPHKPSAVS